MITGSLKAQHDRRGENVLAVRMIVSITLCSVNSWNHEGEKKGCNESLQRKIQQVNVLFINPSIFIEQLKTNSTLE